MSRRLLCAAMVLVVLMPLSSMSSPQSGGSTNSPTPAQTTGKNIGTIISTAFDTAFPIVGKIMDLFKNKTVTPSAPPDKKSKATPVPTEKTVTESEVKAAVDKAQTELKATIKEKIQPTATVAKELGVIQVFASNGSKAQQNIANIKRLLTATAPDYSKISTEWKKFTNQIADILTVSKTDIQLIRDVSIQGRILDLQDTRKQLMIDISDNIDRANAKKADFSKNELEGQITAMGSLLNGFDSLAAAELGMLQSDIGNLATWANAPAGKNTFDTNPPDPELLNVATAAINESKAALHSHSINQ